MTKNNRTYVTILGVNIASTTQDKVLRQIRENLNQKRKFLIVTPNPEHIMLADHDPEFKSILNKAQISIPDATGIIMAAKFLDLPNPKSRLIRVPTLIFQGMSVGLAVFFRRNWLEENIQVIKGRQLFIKIIQLANKKKWKIVLLGDKSDSAKKAQEKLARNYKSIKMYSFQGPNLDNDGKPLTPDDKQTEKELVKKINAVLPHILFIGFGAPKQEKWIDRMTGTLDIGGTMVLGGTFDYVAGTTKLPPKFIDKLGLEWLWRLLTGSQRISRVLNAFPVFPLKVFEQKFNA